MSITNVNPINMGSPMATINVPALKYKSGNRVWYAITISYKVLGKFIHTSSVKKKNQEIIKSEIKNRFLDSKHKNEIKDYIKSEPEFTIPPVTLVSFDELDFRPYTFGDETEEQLNQRFEAVGSMAGVIVLPIDYEFECLDGNHRTVAIRELASESPDTISDSNILLNIVHEKRARKIRQDFVDVNKNVKQTSSSINTLFNTRDRVSGLVVDLIEEIDYLSETTELLATSVSKNSKDIYTINNIKNVITELSGYNSQSVKSEKVSNIFIENEEFEKAVKNKGKLFFDELKYNRFIQECINEREHTTDIRNVAIITSGTGIMVAARVGGYILEKFSHDEAQARVELRKLFQIDWSRKNKLFSGSIVGTEEKILNSRVAISSATNAVMVELGYQINKEPKNEEYRLNF